MWISVCEGSRSEQSANLPGRVVDSNAERRTTMSRARRAAARALAEVRHLPIMALAWLGFSSKKARKASATTDSTCPRTSALPNLPLV